MLRQPRRRYWDRADMSFPLWWQELSLVTAVPVGECAVRAASAIQPSALALPGWGNGAYGRVWDEQFVATIASPMAIFSPYIQARFLPGPDGTHIDVRVGLHPLARGLAGAFFISLLIMGVLSWQLEGEVWDLPRLATEDGALMLPGLGSFLALVAISISRVQSRSAIRWAEEAFDASRARTTGRNWE